MTMRGAPAISVQVQKIADPQTQTGSEDASSNRVCQFSQWTVGTLVEKTGQTIYETSMRHKNSEDVCVVLLFYVWMS